MATYTDINGVKLIDTGDEAGTWGSSTNVNLQILERAANGFAQIALTGTTKTLTLSNQPSAAEDGHYKAIEFTGTPGGACTVTLEQNDHARVYMFLNNTNQNVIITQGSGGNVTIAASDGAIILADGAGSGAQVKDLTATLQAETATKLATARDFSISGDITASAVSFDGTGNVALSSAITADSIVNADINSSAAIADTKLAQITTSSKVANSATTATNANTASAIVARDGSGDFSAGTITANLTGNASGSSGSCTGNAATATALASGQNFSLTGDVTASAVSFNGSGAVALSTAIASGVIVNADINASAAIADTKLDTISTSGKVSNSATTATDANTASAIVARDSSGNFSAGTITATLSGNASTATSATSATSATDATNSTNVFVAESTDDNNDYSITFLSTVQNGGANRALQVDTGGVFFNPSSNYLGVNNIGPASGDFTIDSGADIILDAAGDQIRFKDNGTTRFVFNLDSTPEVEVTGGFTVDCTSTIDLEAIGDVSIKAAGGDITFLGGSGNPGIKFDFSTYAARSTTQIEPTSDAPNLLLAGNTLTDRVYIPAGKDNARFRIGPQPSSTHQTSEAETYSSSASTMNFATSSIGYKCFDDSAATGAASPTRASTNSVPGGAVLQWFGVNDSNYRIYQDKAPTSSSANFGLNFNLTASSGDLTIAGTLTENSDISLKDNIVDVDNALTKVAGLRGRYFTRNDIADEDKRHVGVIAQEIESVLPEVVHTNEETNLKSVSYTSLVPILIEAIKELKTKVEALES